MMQLKEGEKREWESRKIYAIMKLALFVNKVINNSMIYFES